MADATDLQDVSFRRYLTEDLGPCSRIAEEAWPAGPELASEGQEPWSLEGYIESSLLIPNWTDIAYDQDGVAGFLFGRIKGLRGGSPRAGSGLNQISIISRFFFGERWLTRGILGLFWRLSLTEMKLLVNMPRSDATIELFIVGSKHRGRGIGMMLFNRFLKAARNAGASVVTVYTEDKMSNWQFYEKCGFRKVATSHDDLTSYFSGIDTNAIVYALELR